MPHRAALPNVITLCEPLPAPVVIQDLLAADAIKETVKALQGHPSVMDVAVLTRLILEREHRSSTVGEDGVAFPHARTNTVKQPVLAVGVASGGVQFDRNQSVRLILCIAVPHDHPATYLNLLSHLVRRVRHHGVEAFLATRTSVELRALLTA